MQCFFFNFQKKYFHLFNIYLKYNFILLNFKEKIQIQAPLKNNVQQKVLVYYFFCYIKF